jgi:hypothetical protein
MPRSRVGHIDWRFRRQVRWRDTCGFFPFDGDPAGHLSLASPRPAPLREITRGQSFVRDITPNSHAALPGEPSAAFRSSKVISRR